MLRARVEDIDLTADQLTVREKKKDKSKETYRHVPIAASLRDVLVDWLRIHPGGNILFCRTAGEPFTAQMAVHHFRWALEGSEWRVLRGWHAFRHSFISNLASRGIDQRVIMGLVGRGVAGADTVEPERYGLPSFDCHSAALAS
jgi:integrase